MTLADEQLRTAKEMIQKLNEKVTRREEVMQTHARDAEPEVRVYHLKNMCDFWFTIMMQAKEAVEAKKMGLKQVHKKKYERQPNYCSFTRVDVYSHAPSQRCIDIYLDSV